MRPRKANYLIHRWLGLVVSLQLLAWSIGGFMFSVLELETVRGERDVAAAPFDPIDERAISTLPDAVRKTIQTLSSGPSDVATIMLADRGLGPTWEVRTQAGHLVARLDPETGQPLDPLSEDHARRVATRDFAHPAPIARVELIEEAPPIEYRKGALPAYRVEFDHPSALRLYLDANTGQIMARRNQTWRIFDFFWMLHTMDYAGRDDFNHPLLTVFSLLAIATSASGVMLWAWRAVARLHRRRGATQTTASAPGQQDDASRSR